MTTATRVRYSSFHPVPVPTCSPWSEPTSNSHTPINALTHLPLWQHMRIESWVHDYAADTSSGERPKREAWPLEWWSRVWPLAFWAVDRSSTACHLR